MIHFNSIHFSRIKSWSILPLCPLLLILLLHHSTTTTAQSSLCQDDATYLYNSNPKFDCKWVSKNPNKRCYLIDEEYTSIHTVCRQTCTKCNTATPSIAPSIQDPLYELKSIGETCNVNEDCSSNVCTRGICFATKNCMPLKHTEGEPFDTKKINIVFVSSGFRDTTSWLNQVEIIFSEFNNYDPFDYSNPLYNAFYVTDISSQEEDEEYQDGYCTYGCRDIGTLLCCNEKQARGYAKQCFPTSGPNIQTIVIHNDERYGGAGYFSKNIATTSIHSDGPLIAIHELGHSLFELGDEYTYSRSTSTNMPNCDESGCPKWADLAQITDDEICKPNSCQDGNYYSGPTSIMHELRAPIGEVNLRYTCCTFLAMTHSSPAYCDKYNAIGDGLLQYCQKDYQRYGGAELYQDLTESSSFSSDTSWSYLLISMPIVLTIDIEDESYEYADELVESIGPPHKPALFQRRQVIGDHMDMYDAVVESGISTNITKVTVYYHTGYENEMFFLHYTKVSAPPKPPRDDTDDSSRLLSEVNRTLTEEEEDDDDVMVETTIIQIVVEGKHGDIIDIEIETIEITWWFYTQLELERFFGRIWDFLKKLFTIKNPESLKSFNMGGRV